MPLDGNAGGSIVNVSSIMGVVGDAGPAYNASKSGILLHTKSVAACCAHEGLAISVNSVHGKRFHFDPPPGACRGATPARLRGSRAEGTTT